MESAIEIDWRPAGRIGGWTAIWPICAPGSTGERRSGGRGDRAGRDDREARLTVEYLTGRRVNKDLTRGTSSQIQAGWTFRF